MTSTERTVAVVSSMAHRRAGFTSVRGARSLVFEGPPAPVLNQDGVLVGVSVMVRLFEGATEIPIDPHRVIVNPPTIPRSRLSYEEGTQDEAGRFVGSGRIVAEKTATEGIAHRRIVGAPDPEAALIEAVWDSIEGTPNPSGWRR